MSASCLLPTTFDPTRTEGEVERITTFSQSLCGLNETIASALAVELDRLPRIPVELGETYEDLANVYLRLADKVRERQLARR